MISRQVEKSVIIFNKDLYYNGINYGLSTTIQRTKKSVDFC